MTAHVLSHTRRRPSPGAGWRGTPDMADNFYEWVADWCNCYPAEAQIDPHSAEKEIGHVLRGGSWFDDWEYVRSANRHVIR